MCSGACGRCHRVSGSREKGEGAAVCPAYDWLVQERENPDLQRCLSGLAQFLDGLGLKVLDRYDSAGILAAMPDQVFPIADARFKRHHHSVTYHPRGAVYFTITRQGELKMSGQQEGEALTAALAPYVKLGQLRTSQFSRIEEAPTEWFPPPRLLLDTETTDLFIASVSSGTEISSRTIFVPLEQYIRERARLFVEAFKALAEPPRVRPPERAT